MGAGLASFAGVCAIAIGEGCAILDARDIGCAVVSGTSRDAGGGNMFGLSACWTTDAG